MADPVSALPPAVAAAPLHPEKALDAATAEYLAHAGRFAAARELVLEAGLYERKKNKGGGGGAESEEDAEAAGKAAADALVAPFVEAEAVLSRLRFPRCDAEPALAWLASKRRAMSSSKTRESARNGRSGDGGGGARADALEFSLLRARFSAVLTREGPRAALRFVNSRMVRFAQGGDSAQSKKYLDEIMRLMGAVVLFDDGGDKKNKKGSGGVGGGEEEEEREDLAGRTTRARAAAAAATPSSPSSRSRQANRQKLPERYRDLFSRSLWDAAAGELAAAACELAGAPSKPPLLVAAAAGAAALPTLLKLANKVSARGPGRTAAVVVGGGGGSGAAAAAAGDADGRASAAAGAARVAGRDDHVGDARDFGVGGGENNSGDKDDEDDAALPVDLNLGPEFAFTTIFSCPVSRDTGTKDNPPMLLPCGHVFCRAAVSGISRGGPASRAFKCPLCPTEATPGSCRALVFPPFGAMSVGGGGRGGEKAEEDGKDGGEDELMVSD